MSDQNSGTPSTFRLPGFEYAFRLALGAAPFRLTEPGECIGTAARITDGDFDSWFDEWTAAGERAAGIAAEAEASEARVSAREAWLRASYYHSAAFFYVLGTRDPSRSKTSFSALRGAFDRAVDLWPTQVERVFIPYERDLRMPGYWFSAAAGSGPRPLVILNNGSDGQVIGMLRHGGVAAIERGWHALIFEGPGQGAMLYEHGVAFRHDWEAVITPVVDFALARADVDPDRIALLGVSQAGYWAPRAAAFEHRLAALIADPGVARVWTSWFDQLPPEAAASFNTASKAEFDAGVAAALAQAPASARFEFAKRSEPYGTSSLYDILHAVRRYDLTGIAQQIRCPTLVTDPEGEQFWPGQSKELYDALTSTKTLQAFTAAEGAAGHCEPLTSTLFCQRVFDWLQRVFQEHG